MALQQQKAQITEHQARCYLEDHGLVFVEKNYQVKCGEIDLIMKDEAYLVFIEVRYRCNSNFGSSIETIRPSKQNRIIRTAQHYLQKYDLIDQVDCRFDVVGIDANHRIIWIKDAFQVQY